MKNCNRIHREGRCDGAEWIECTYCGAIDNAPCIGIKKPDLPQIDAPEYVRSGLKSIGEGAQPHPQELTAIVIWLMRRIEVLELTHNAEITGG